MTSRSAPPPARLARQAGGYLLVGGSAALVDIGMFHLLVPQSGTILLPAVASFLIAAAWNYSLCALWLYRRNWRSLHRAGKFLLFATAGLCVNAGVTYWLAWGLSIPPTLAKIGGVAAAFCLNFLMNTFIVFRTEDV